MQVKVFLRKSTPVFDRVYTYLVPSNLEDSIGPGVRVLFPFGSGDKLSEGFVFSILDKTEEVQGKALKTIEAVIDSQAVLTLSQLKLVSQMKLRYGCTYGMAAELMFPRGTKLKMAEDVVLTDRGKSDLPADFLEHFKEEDSIPLDDLSLAGFSRKEVFAWENLGYLNVQTKINRGLKAQSVEFCRLLDENQAKTCLNEQALGSIQQELAVTYLLEEGEVPVMDLLQACDINRTSLRTLQKKGFLEFFRLPLAQVQAMEEDPDREELLPQNLTEVSADMLTPGQKEALATIETGVKEGKARPEYLLFGITGSGKTEVYMRLAKAALDRGETCIILVPEISLTPQMTAQFEKRFSKDVMVIHSRLTPRERYNRWERILLGQAKIVVGPRSAVFSPLENLGLIIIDEEQEDTYKSDLMPRYDARTIARLRQLNEGPILVLGSATPSVESYVRTMEHKSTLLTLKERPGKATLPQTELIDLRRYWNPDTDGLLSQPLLDAMRETLDKDQQVLLFLNRRGFAASYVCGSCGKSYECPHCSIGMTYHKKRNRLVCHYCGHMESLHKACPHCGEEAMRLVGVGTEKLEALCQHYFPDARVVRMDQDRTMGKNAHAKLLKSFREAPRSILIGTQMVAKGHDFPDLTLAAVVLADQMLGRNDIRAAEKAFQLMTQAGGRAGRKDLAGRFFIQAFDIDHYAVRAASKQDYPAFLEDELAFRKALHYPPFSARALLVISGEDEAETRKSAGAIYRVLDAKPGISALKPAKSPIYKLRGRYRWQILLRAPAQGGTRLLSGLWQQLSLHKWGKTVTLTCTLDPA
jgi:primosomal protein N' (replication factor Y)